MALPHETAPYWAVSPWPGLRLSFVVLALQCGVDAPVHSETTLLQWVMATRYEAGVLERSAVNQIFVRRGTTRWNRCRKSLSTIHTPDPIGVE